MSPSISLKAVNITKRYGDKTALDDISFEVNKGELFGFIGPDGAGKTTLFRLITSLLIPDRGSLTVDGLDTVKDYTKLRKILGYMPGRFSLYQDLTVEENLRFFAGIFKTTLEANYDLVKDIYSHIEPFKTRKAGKLSGGMKQKLALSCALIHKPEILVLDEPTTGVDAVSRIEFWEMLNKLRQSGITIVVSTPYMDEASRCDRVAAFRAARRGPGSFRDWAAHARFRESSDAASRLRRRAPDRAGSSAFSAAIRADDPQRPAPRPSSQSSVLEQRPANNAMAVQSTLPAR